MTAATTLLDRAPQQGGVLVMSTFGDRGTAFDDGTAAQIIDRTFAGNGTLFGKGSGVSRGGTCLDGETFGAGRVGLPAS